MNEVKITLNHSSLQVVVNSLKYVDFFTDNDYGLIMKSLCADLLVRFHKKLLEQRQKQSFTLRMHEAIALRVLLGSCEYAHSSFEENELLLIVNDLDRKL